MFAHVLDCGLHADCVRFVPNRSDLFVVSCYELDEKTGYRVGKLILAKTTSEVLQEVGGIAGVFDFYWSNDRIISVAVAHGAPLFFELVEERLVQLKTCCAVDFEMTLSVTGSLGKLITSDNCGSLRISALQSNSLEVLHAWTGHDAEIWYVSQDRFDANLFYSGADDGVMRGWDTRLGSTPVFTDKRSHEAGVCCVVSDPHHEFIFASGSYDEAVRIWDHRALNKPLHTVQCGSGAWRVIWNPQKANEFGVAAMRAGFKIFQDLQLAREESVGEEAVAYGLDLSSDLIVSCSFYNNSCQIWQ